MRGEEDKMAEATGRGLLGEIEMGTMKDVSALSLA